MFFKLFYKHIGYSGIHTLIICLNHQLCIVFVPKYCRHSACNASAMYRRYSMTPMEIISRGTLNSIQYTHKRGSITNNKSCRKYESENCVNTSPGHSRGGVGCLGVSIPCRPVTPAVSPISRSGTVCKTIPSQNQCFQVVRKKHILQHFIWWEVVQEN
jgi:hypothetical protein